MRQKLHVLRAAQRTDLSLFLVKAFELLHPGQPTLELRWYLDAICHLLQEAKAGRCRRAVITVPPRHLKSVTASVVFVAWLLGHDPATKIMVASYSEDLARDHARLCRTLMETFWYQQLFPTTRISDRGNRTLELITTRGGVRKAVSVGGSVTGFGADYIIVDDCMKADDVRSAPQREAIKAWFENTLLTRLNDKLTGRIISIQQRLHEDDLPAHLLAKGYQHLNLPAIAEREERIPLWGGRSHHRKVGDVLNSNREDRRLLDGLRRELGSAVFSAQYQQEPAAPEGNLLRLEWFGTYHKVPSRESFRKVVQSWDTGMTAAPTSDYSVCTTWGFRDNKWYLLEVFRRRMDYPDLKSAVILLHAKWGADAVLIEDAGSGKSLSQELKVQGHLHPMVCPARESKEERLIGCLGEIESGLFLLPSEALWLQSFQSELRAFPAGRHDDQVDSMTQFINYQLLNWPWVLTQYDDTGRPIDIIREEVRPF
jgi:predicted phage terminase large subunit-like protein